MSLNTETRKSNSILTFAAGVLVGAAFYWWETRRDASMLSRIEQIIRDEFTSERGYRKVVPFPGGAG